MTQLLTLEPHSPVRRLRRSPKAAEAAEFDRMYWLEHCEGYRVEAADGRLGVVEEVRRAADGGTALAVRAGRLGRRLLLVPVAEVAFVVPRAERIWLRSPVSLAGTEARVSA